MCEYKTSSNSVEIISADYFDPEQIFTCGQCFRWYEQPNGSFTGVAHGKVLNVEKRGKNIVFNNCNEQDYLKIWKNYFDLERDYGKIKKGLSADPILKDAVLYGSGIRILRQDFFEALISFIISANNNIPRIQGIINRFSALFGEKLEYNGDVFYAFPKPEALDGIKESDLAPLKSGYRAKYIVSAIKSYLRGEIDQKAISEMSAADAQKALCKISGVGPKVADCILLFSFGKFDVFPTDVWVKRVMGELYGCDEKDARETGYRIFGDNAGIAQQYLFYWRRAQ